MIHLQKATPNWLEAQAKLPSQSLFKAVDEGSKFVEVKALDPNVKTVLRHWYDPGQVFGGTWEDNLNRARLFFPTFIDGTFREQYAQHCDFIEEFNEYLANSQTEEERAARVLWAKACAHVWLYEYRVFPELAHIRLALTGAAVGNWIDRRFAEIARDYDCAISYHPYDYWNHGVRADEGFQAATSMLWDAMELDWGIDVDWLFTECGPFESAVDGWKSPNCLGGDRQKYVDAVQQWIWDVQQTPAYQEGRIVGFNLFTTDYSDDKKFSSYWTVQPELNMLADMVAAEWKPGTYVPPPNPIDCIKTEQYTKYHMLRPRTLDNSQWDYLRQLMEDGIDIFGIGRVVIGYEGWSHLDAIGSIRNAIEANFTKSRLIVLDGDKIGTGLDRTWMDANCPLMTPFTFWITTPSAFWVYPVAGHTMPVLQDWAKLGAPRDYDGDGILDDKHEGIDLPCNYRDSIVAIRSGTVTWASDKRHDGQDSLLGNHIIIEHDDNYISWYGHLDEMIVDRLDYVEQGQLIGYAGSTGNSTGVHLHLIVQLIGSGLSGYVLPDIIDPEQLFLGV